MTASDPAIPSPSVAAGRVGILAGGGALPVALAETLDRHGTPPFVLLIEGEASAVEALTRHPHRWIAIEDPGRLIPLLREGGATCVVMAGTVSRRPRLSGIRWTLGLFALLPRLAQNLRRGDDALLRTVVEAIEKAGIAVVGAHEIAPDLLAPEGRIGGPPPSIADRRDIDAALQAARAIGAIDVGQAAVAIGGRAVALEGIEGTDLLLDRVAGLRGHGRLAGREGGVLAKAAKPKQELRADLPTIGVETVVGAHRAGLRGIAVEALHTLVLDRAGVERTADELGIFVVGIAGGGR